MAKLSTAYTQGSVSVSFDHVVSNLPPGHSYTADQLIDEHTLLPLFAPFIDSARYQQAKLDMRGNGGAGIRTRLGSNEAGNVLL